MRRPPGSTLFPYTSSSDLVQRRNKIMAEAVVVSAVRTPIGRANKGVLRDVRDRKSTRLNSSHVEISYAVFCLKKKNEDHHGRAASADGHARRRLLPDGLRR